MKKMKTATALQEVFRVMITLSVLMGPAVVQAEQASLVQANLVEGTLEVRTDDEWGSNAFALVMPESVVERSCRDDGMQELHSANLFFQGTLPDTRTPGATVVYNWHVVVAGSNSAMEGTLQLNRYHCGALGRCILKDSYTVPTIAQAEGAEYLGVREELVARNIGVHRKLFHSWRVKVQSCPPSTPENPHEDPNPEEFLLR